MLCLGIKERTRKLIKDGLYMLGKLHTYIYITFPTYILARACQSISLHSLPKLVVSLTRMGKLLKIEF
jgi:hypothetical protein